MHKARGLKVVEQGRKLGELHRFPEREAGEYDDDTHRDDADIEHLLDGVVVGEVIMAETKGESIAHGGDQLTQADRKKLSPETSGDGPVEQIGKPIERHDPHPEKMPLQTVLRPFAERDGIGKPYPAENHVVVINLPTAHDHYDHGGGIDPMHD